MNPSSKTWIAAAAMLLLGLGGGWTLSQWQSSHDDAAPAPAERKVLYWYDPMVPTQRFDQPGKSPFMDMQLVPRYADEAGAQAAQAAQVAPAVVVSPQTRQSLGLRLARAEMQVLAPVLEVVGTLGLNEREISIVQARASGFVERVYARAPGDVVAAGAPLADLLHPEWLAAQREYLALRATGDAVLAQAARARLALLGMPAALVERVDASGQPQALTTITAPAGGLITELAVRQGMTVAAGMTLARINGLATVWVEAAVPQALAASVAAGQAAELRLPAFAGEVLRGKVTAVLAEASSPTRSLRVRIELPNPRGRLRAGMSGQVRLQGAGPAGEVLSVPEEAVIRTGRRALVYVLDAPDRYRPVEVELGAAADGRVAILHGLSAGQQVVASGQFLIDSEASLLGLTAPPAAASAADAGSAAAPGAEFGTRGRVVEIGADAITLEHEPVAALKWPAMTMPFLLAQPALARGLAVGDAVVFRFRQQGDEHLVTAIERAGQSGQGAQGAHGDHAGHGTGGRP